MMNIKIERRYEVEGLGCRHWYWLRRLFRRRRFCRKCEARIDWITRDIMAHVEAQLMSSLKQDPAPTNPAPKGLIEGWLTGSDNGGYVN